MPGKRGCLLACLFALIVVSGVAVTGCSGSDDSDSSSIPVFHQGDEIAVDNGQEFVIALTANPSTGYSWQSADNPKVKYISSTQVPAGGQTPGAPGTQELKYKAIATGTTTLELAYYRQFEAGIPPADTTSFAITIK